MMKKFKDNFGEFIYSDPEPLVPSFPCEENTNCTSINRICKKHKYVIFVILHDKNDENNTVKFEIPYGKWECYEWYTDRIVDITQIDRNKFYLMFAGCYVGGFKRDSRLQFQSTIHLFFNKEDKIKDDKDDKDE
jgi:hypothetical protein